MADSGGNLAAVLDTLKDVRSLEYEVDLLTQKLKKCEKTVLQLEAANAEQAKQLKAAQKAASGVLGVVTNAAPVATTGAGGKASVGAQPPRGALTDKENVIA